MTVTEESPRHCDVCGNDYPTPSSAPAGETPCPECGSRTWFDRENNQQNAIVNAAHSLDTELLEQLTASGYSIVLEFSQVDHLSPSVFARLLAVDRKLKTQGKRLKLAGFQPDVLNIIKIAKLDTRFEVYETSADALDHSSSA